MEVGLFVCLMTHNISLSSNRSHQHSTDAVIPTIPRKKRICKRIVTAQQPQFMMSNWMNCRVHLYQMQVRWEFLRDAKHFVPGPWAVSSCTRHEDKPEDAKHPLQFKPTISEGVRTGRNGILKAKSGKVTVSRERANNQSFSTKARVCHSKVFSVTISGI